MSHPPDYSDLAQSFENAIIETVTGDGDPAPMHELVHALGDYLLTDLYRRLDEQADLLAMLHAKFPGTNKKEPHAITRARERFGLELTHEDLDRISALIRNGAPAFKTNDDGSVAYLVYFSHTFIAPVVHRGTIVTMLVPFDDVIRRFGAAAKMVRLIAPVNPQMMQRMEATA